MREKEIKRAEITQQQVVSEKHKACGQRHVFTFEEIEEQKDGKEDTSLSMSLTAAEVTSSVESNYLDHIATVI